MYHTSEHSNEDSWLNWTIDFFRLCTHGILETICNCKLRLSCCSFWKMAYIYDSIDVIYDRRGFIRLATCLDRQLLIRDLDSHKVYCHL